MTARAAAHDRIAIIGCGHVGATSAYALMMRGAARELVLIDSNREIAEGEAMDLQHAVPMHRPVRIRAGDYADAAQAAIVVIAAGVGGEPGESRLDLVGRNVSVVRECMKRLRAEGFTGIVLMTTNPVDVLAQVAQEESNLPVGRVIGSGTLLDSARLRAMLGAELGVEARSVHAYIIGEHGDSEIAAWSSAHIAGVPLNRCATQEPQDYARMLERVRRAAPEVVRRKGHTEYAIGLCVQRICEAVLRTEHAVLAVSTVLGGEYGLTGVCLGTPCVVGKNGIERIIQLDLDDGELAALHRSAETLQRLHPRMSAGAA